jgi:chemotaxis protein CheC
MTAIHLEPRPPQTLADMLGAIVSTVLTHVAGAGEIALVMDSDLQVEGEACELSFVLVPSDEGVSELLARLGLGS